MNENNHKEITVDDFNFICRVCLRIGEDMIDIFRSGVENKIMEVTNLKMKLDDKLPKSLCLKCSHQINQLFIFLQQAKSSDIYLKTLLSNSKNNCTNPGFKAVDEESVNKKILQKKNLMRLQKKSKPIKEIKNDLESDKMYLICVPEDSNCDSNLESDIIIKDLNSESDNLELVKYCRTLVKSYFSDHTYPKEQGETSNDDHQILGLKSNCFSELKHDSNKIYTVNLNVYECSECKVTFEECNDLTTHFSVHEVQPFLIKNNFSCPICDFSIKEKFAFMNHLRDHRKKGFFFVKINGANEIVPSKEDENDIFSESFTKECKVFCVNLNSLTCSACSKNLESKDNILNHLESCFCKDKSHVKFCISYVCPICYKLFTGNLKLFIKHLSFHKKENCYFIKVDGNGEPIHLEEDDHLFVPFEEAVKIFSEKNEIFQIVDINSCDKCDFSSELYNELLEHCSYTHSENVTNKNSFCCPVCMEEYRDEDMDEKLEKFYKHLKIHKDEGICFILVKKNGMMAGYQQKYSDIFTQSLFLWSFINSYTMLLQNVSPKLLILDQIKTTGKYTCDLCKEQFKKKYEIVTHLKSHQLGEVFQDNVNYICEKCGKKCLGKLSYKKHFLKHSKGLSSINRHPICTICNKVFANKATLSGHMRHHVKEGVENDSFTSSFQIICEKCGKSFSSSASLTRHKKMHSKEKENNVLKCEICSRDFFRQASFDRHKSAHLNSKYFECGICKFPLPSVTSLQKHSEIHKNGSNTFDCRACKLSFLTKDSLTAHQTHTGHYLDRKPLECNVCHEKFFIGRKFTEHIKTHPKYKMGECTLCGKRLSTIQSLMLHMGRHFESNSILCPHCGKQFFEERNYHRHLLTHEGIKPYSCDVEDCKKSFYTLFELNRHKKYHNNTRDFRCLYCSKSFHEANHLTVHVRTHTGERPYTCPHCNKGFVTRTHCKHHIKLVHQGIGYDLIKSSISKKVTVFEAIETVA